MYVELFQSTKGVTVVPRVLSRKSSADFYNVSNPFLHCLVYFVLILHWHQDFRVLKLYQPVYKKVPIRYFGEHPDEFNPKTFNCFQRRCQCDCSLRSPGHLCALSDGRERVQYATHLLGT